MENKIAVIYARKSRENAVTLDGQVESCIEWCKRNDVEYEIFAEEGDASSEDWNRPKLQQMIKAIENLEFNLVVATEQTRICRDDHFPIFKELCRDTETLFVTADNNSIFNFSDPDDELKSDILQAVGKNELSRTKIRLKRGTVQSAKKGNWQGKKSPIGYTYDHDTKRLKLNDDAKVVRRMFEMYLEGHSTPDISYKFIQENVMAYHKVKGEMVPITWSKSTISRSLKNITYAGHTRFGKTKIKKMKGEKYQIPVDEELHLIVEDTHEPIVTPEEFKKVQEIMNRKRTVPPAMKHAKHTFSGLIRCESCGKTRTFERQMSLNRDWRISSCTTRVYSDDFSTYKMCGNSGSKLDVVENLFYKYLEGLETLLEDHIENIKNEKISIVDLQQAKEAKKQMKRMQVEKMKQKRKKIRDLIEDDFYEDDEELEKRQEMKELYKQIKNMEREIEEMDLEEEASEAVQVEKSLQYIKNFLQGKHITMDKKILNDILHEFVDHISYSKVGRSAEVKIKVYLKDEVNEIMNSMKEVI